MSFPWKLNRYSYSVQFVVNCTTLNRSKLSNFIECTIKLEIRSNTTPQLTAGCDVYPSTQNISTYKCRRNDLNVGESTRPCRRNDLDVGESTCW